MTRNTTGLTEMDWFLSHLYLPPECDAHFSEGLWRLPRLSFCYRGDHALPESRWEPGETIWLGSLNRYLKMHEQTLALRARSFGRFPWQSCFSKIAARREQRRINASWRLWPVTALPQSH